MRAGDLVLKIGRFNKSNSAVKSGHKGQRGCQIETLEKVSIG